MEPMGRRHAGPAPDLAAVAAEVLGELAFMVAEDDPGAARPAGAAWLEGTISYRGPVGGALSLWCPQALATRLAANLLGLEADAGSARVRAADALGEFLNVLCGQLVTAWHGRQAVFNLALPAVRECAGPPGPETLPARNWCRLRVEGEPLVCAYRQEG